MGHVSLSAKCPARFLSWTIHAKCAWRSWVGCRCTSLGWELADELHNCTLHMWNCQVRVLPRTQCTSGKTQPNNLRDWIRYFCADLNELSAISMKKIIIILAGWPAGPGPYSSLKNRNGSTFGPLFGRNGPFWEVRGIEISTRDRRGALIWAPLFWGEHSKNHSNHAVDRPKCMLFQEFASHSRKRAHRKNAYFSKFRSRSFLHCFPPSAARSLKRTKNTGGSKLGFGTPWPILRLRGWETSVWDCVTKQQGFTTCCLSLWCRRCLWRVSSSQMTC